jgi:preprotein translocase subunit SecB
MQDRDTDMAEQDGETQGAGVQEQFTNGADNLPQAGLISQYVKDLSFENPNAPAVYQWNEQPRVDVQFNIGAQRVGEDFHEVLLKLEVTATAPSENKTAFAVDLTYAGLFGIRNVPEDQIQPFLLTEAPRLIFPFARRVLADAVRDGGFQPLLLDPIDFNALYAQQATSMTGSGGEEIQFGQA